MTAEKRRQVKKGDIIMTSQKVRVGMIGYQFMGKAHGHAYSDLEGGLVS